MQVILLDKVVNLGNLGEIVKVKDGYARNFLIPSGRARRATEAAKAEFEARRAELEKAAAAKLAEQAEHALFAHGGWLSGHTLKHLLAAAAALWLARQLGKRAAAGSQAIFRSSFFAA